MKKLLRITNKIFFTLCILTFLAFSGTTVYFCYAINTINQKELEQLETPKSTKIYDETNHLIEDFGNKQNSVVKYNQLPKDLINALISIEDQSFFEHKGVDFKGVVRSIVNNITTTSRQGGSTITQQLVKNLILTNEVSLKRKIQEAYLAYQLEEKYSKEEILELYFNRIYFDATQPGVSYAAYRFFNKDVENLSLVECALLAGLVKSPSLYSPFKYQDKANERKNVVLKRMLDLNYITNFEYDVAFSIHVKDFVIEKGSTFQEKTFKYQAYLDVVYEEAKNITSYSPFDKAMKIETYLDTSLQTYIDNIQKGINFEYVDDLVQIASCVIDNNSLGVKAMLGGRNYNGMRLYNRAYDMKRQPASTMKPIFTYALAMEYLNYHEYSYIEDKPYTYKGTNITVQNADKKYLGEISLTEALGYSRNTSTLYTLEKVISKVGEGKVIDYLKSINLMDDGVFALPYAIGGMRHGVSPFQLCNAYSVLANLGLYKKASTIKKITFLDTNEVVYDHEKLESNRVLSKEASYLITSTLSNVRKGNYLNINAAFPSDINCIGKTGTNAYDNNVIKNYSFPNNADRDVWFAGYSKNYSIVTWAGFDEPIKGKKTYFTYNDKRRKYPKMLFKELMSRCENKNTSFEMPDTLVKQNVIVTKNGTFLPNTYIPSSFLKTITVRKDKTIKNVLEAPSFNNELTPKTLYLNDELFISLNEVQQDIYVDFFGTKGYYVTYHDLDFNSFTYFFETNEFFIPLYNEIFAIEIIETYKDNQKIHSSPYIISTY